ncbi:hypothetical protein V4V32_10375 [Enterococcus casseliflavus]|uniref:hypothetical protein n=1 Tax=Enterococcus casseliflavus TaxID=37734 RepID=UPI002FBF1897
MNHDKPSLGDKIQSTLGPFASKVNGNIYITSVRDAMLAYMPFTFIASIFLIIAFFPIQQVTDFITMVLRTEDASVWQDALCQQCHTRNRWFASCHFPRKITGRKT